MQETYTLASYCPLKLKCQELCILRTTEQCDKQQTYLVSGLYQPGREILQSIVIGQLFSYTQVSSYCSQSHPIISCLHLEIYNITFSLLKIWNFNSISPRRPVDVLSSTTFYTFGTLNVLGYTRPSEDVS